MARGFDIEAVNLAQADGGAIVGPRPKYNFVPGPGGLSIAVADNEPNDSIDVTFDTTGVGGGVFGAADAGPQEGPQPAIRLIAGANITIALFEDLGGSELEFTIASTSGFPGYFAGTPTADGGVGAPGIDPLAARGDHQHPRSSAYTIETATTAFVTTTGSISFNPGFTGQPFLLISIWEDNRTSGGVGAAIGGGGLLSAQACHSLDHGDNAHNDFFDTRIMSSSNQNPNNAIYTITTFNQSNIFISRSGDTPGDTVSGRVFAFGS